MQEAVKDELYAEPEVIIAVAQAKGSRPYVDIVDTDVSDGLRI